MTKITNEIIEEFLNLNNNPRMSKHEEKVSKYLYDRCNELGLSVERDQSNNVIVFKKAEEEFEDVPTLILQAHMDMVCVSDKQYDFLNNPVETIIDEEHNTIYAKGTSLGGDDGIGIAVILQILKDKDIKSSIRAIFTTDEEKGMSGAYNIDKKYLEGKYLVNVDWEDINSICISSAGARDTVMTKKFNRISNDKKYSYRIAVKDLPGGHSGIEIYKNIDNAILKINDALTLLIDKGIRFNMVALSGGNASNAIPSQSKVEITTNINIDEFKNFLCEVDNNIKYDVCEIDNVLRTMDELDTKNIVSFLRDIPDGVYLMSDEIKDFVITSSNVGIVQTEDELIKFEIMLRSSDSEKMKEMYNKFEESTKKYEFSIAFDKDAPSWPYNRDSKLLIFVKEAFKEVMLKEAKLEPVHAGLECGYFVLKNPDLEVISLGPTVECAHSVNEKIYIDDIEKSYNVIKKIIEKVNKNI